MKSNKINKLAIVLLTMIITISCVKEEETVIIPKTFEQYKTEFQEFVSAQLDIVNNCVWGYNKGDFRSQANYDSYTSNYRAKLEAAQLILNQDDLTIADIMKANSSISADGKNFQSSLYISDRRPLHEVIVSCETLNEEVLEGTASGNAPAESKSEFEAAIAAAKVVRNATTTIERQVSEEVENLNKAKDAFEASIIE